MIKNYKVNKYVVIDYENILSLTRKYLRKTLAYRDYKKIIFCNFEDFQFKKDFFKKKYIVEKFDLFINSDSFHEIEKTIIKKYLRYFSSICEVFFIKNAIAKYKIKDLVNHLSYQNIPKFNKNLGLNNEIINIFDNTKIQIQIQRYLKRYNPYKKKVNVVYQLSEIYPTTILSLYINNK